MSPTLVTAEIVKPDLSASEPTFALALGGGGARGLSHIHIIEALDELGIRPVAISGSSIGAIMGAGMASGMSGAEIRDHSLASIGNKKAVASRIWGLRPTSVRGLRIGQFDLERVLRAFLPQQVPDDFADLHIPLKVVTTDYYGQAEVVIEDGDLIQALAASAAIPAVFMPVRIRDRVMIDGGIINPVPYEHLMPIADIVIGVDVVGAPDGDGTHVPNRMESVFGSGQLMMQTAIALKLRLQPPQIFLCPAVGRIGVMDFLKANEILAMSVGIKDELKRAIDTALALRATA
jgi:NTE family protein